MNFDDFSGGFGGFGEEQKIEDENKIEYLCKKSISAAKGLILNPGDKIEYLKEEPNPNREEQILIFYKFEDKERRMDKGEFKRCFKLIKKPKNKKNKKSPQQEEQVNDPFGF